MTTPTADPTPKTIDSADRQYLETYGDALVQNTHLRLACLALLLMTAAAIGSNFYIAAKAMNVKPIIVRVDELGRHETVSYAEATNNTPGAKELKRDLSAFVMKHYGRRHGAVSRDFPESLFFVEPTYGEGLKRAENPALLKFLSTPSAEETDIENVKVKLTDTSQTPFRAAVDFDKVFYQPGTRHAQKKTETYTVQLEYELLTSVPPALVQFNPLGLQITHLQIEQASF